MWNLLVLKKKKCRGCFSRCSRHCKSAVGESNMSACLTAGWVRLCRWCQLMCAACLSSVLRKVCPWEPQHPGHGAVCSALLQVGVVSAFAQTLRRYTSLNHLAQAARAVLQNTSQINQMLSDLNRVDFANVQVTYSIFSQAMLPRTGTL